MKSALLLGMSLVLLGGSALADDLATADKLLNAREYAQALPIYAKLAAAGNPAAQFHLGEMYWYGEGVPADMAKGDEWFRKAAAAGSAEAREALALSAQRKARQPDIDYYVQRYDGADVALAKFNCGQPAIPARSENNKDIKEISGAIDKWQACYKGFIKNLQDQLPAGKAIPADLANLMTDAEIQQATARMNQAYAEVNAEAKKQSDQIMAASDSWHKQTAEYVHTENARTQQVLLERERELRATADAEHNSGPVPTKH